MSYIEKEKLIKADIASIENRVRHAFNQGYDLGYKEGKANCSEIPTGSPKYCDRSICLKNECNNVGCEDCEVTKSQEPTQSPIIDWNNCHTSEQLDSIATTKNNLGVDAISRADARSLICKIDRKHHTFGMSWKVFKDLYDGMDELPSVTPQEPKTGHWIDDEFGSKCSCCGVHTHLDKFDRPMKFKHCSMCGARMVEPQESEDKE